MVEEKFKDIRISLNRKDFILIEKATIISSQNLTDFFRNSAKLRALKILRYWGEVPLQYYMKEGKDEKVQNEREEVESQ